MNDNHEDEPIDERDFDESLLPAWFIKRMSNDSWHFGLLLVSGEVLAISSIIDIHKASDGTVWIDVRMIEKDDASHDEVSFNQSRLFYSPTFRTRASINTNHVVAAFEIATAGGTIED